MENINNFSVIIILIIISMKATILFILVATNLLEIIYQTFNPLKYMIVRAFHLAINRVIIQKVGYRKYSQMFIIINHGQKKFLLIDLK